MLLLTKTKLTVYLIISLCVLLQAFYFPEPNSSTACLLGGNRRATGHKINHYHAPPLYSLLHYYRVGAPSFRSTAKVALICTKTFKTTKLSPKNKLGRSYGQTKM